MDQDVTVEAMHTVLSLLRLLRPHRVEGVPKTRVGRLFDGGYVMLDSFEDVGAAYSLGINDDVSWDLDMAARGIPVFQFDHTIERLPREHELFRWERTGIAHQADPGRSLDTLPSLMARNGHDGARDLVLKCDIEGYEWDVLAFTPSRILGQFRQIVLELHDLQNLREMAFANLAHRAVRNLLLTHRVVHVHGNNFARWAVVGGVPVPRVIELSFARLDHGAFIVSDEVFPTALDMPCHSKEADLYLGRFAFD